MPAGSIEEEGVDLGKSRAARRQDRKVGADDKRQRAAEISLLDGTIAMGGPRGILLPRHTGILGTWRPHAHSGFYGFPSPKML